MWDIRIIVFPRNELMQPFHLHGQAKKRVIGLYFTGSHCDYLEGESGALPKSILRRVSRLPGRGLRLLCGLVPRDASFLYFLGDIGWHPKSQRTGELASSIGSATERRAWWAHIV